MKMQDYTESRIREFILDDHPCVMAQSVFADDNVTLYDYKKMDDEKQQIKLLSDIKTYVDNQEEAKNTFQTFIAVFKKSKFQTELEFENAMWKLLHNLHEMDESEWDPNTNPDTGSSKFSFSLLGTSFYLVGMHPMSSRFARKSPYPLIVFNLHSQFDVLREVNRYTRVRDLIRRRDKAFQGFINPMLEDFGKNSEARQYSGRAVPKDWKCPYNFKK